MNILLSFMTDLSFGTAIGSLNSMDSRPSVVTLVILAVMYFLTLILSIEPLN